MCYKTEHTNQPTEGRTVWTARWIILKNELYLVTFHEGILGQLINYLVRGAHGVRVIVVENVRGDSSSNPGRDWLHFT